MNTQWDNCSGQLQSPAEVRPWGRAATPPLLAETHPASPQTSQLTLLVLQGIGLMESRWGDFKHAVSSCFLFFPPTLAASFISVYSRDAHGHTPQCTASKAQDDTHGHTQTHTSVHSPQKPRATHTNTPQRTPSKAQNNTYLSAQPSKPRTKGSWTKSCHCADSGCESMIPKLISKWLVGGWFSLGCAPKLEAYLEISSWIDLLGLLRIFQFHFEDYIKEP